MPVFILHFLQFFRGAEVPDRRPEIPAPGSSGPCFHLSLLRLSPFGDSLCRGSGFLPWKFSPEIFGGPEIPVLGPEYPVQENLAKSFCVFLSGGGPEICPGNFRGPEYPALNPGISGLPWLYVGELSQELGISW